MEKEQETNPNQITFYIRHKSQLEPVDDIYL